MRLPLALVLAAAALRAQAASLAQADAIRVAAEAGDARAQAQLGRLYENGDGGLPRDPAQAAAWMLRSARQGRVGSEDILAYYYLQGFGVERDPSLALYWFRAAAAQDDPVGFKEMTRLQNAGVKPAEDPQVPTLLRGPEPARREAAAIPTPAPPAAAAPSAGAAPASPAPRPRTHEEAHALVLLIRAAFWGLGAFFAFLALMAVLAWRSLKRRARVPIDGPLAQR